jgi:hypothetical protein
VIDEGRLHREIDGENTPEESGRLREELQGSPDARARLEGLRRLARDLDAVPRADPPGDLVDDVMRVVRSRALPARRRPGWREAMVAALVRQPALSFGGALAAGMVIGALLGGVGDSTRLDDKSGGTMLPAGRIALPEIDRAVLTGVGLHGEAVLSRAEGQVEFRVRLDGPSPVDLVATFDGHELEPIAFDRNGAGVGEIVLGPDSLRVREAGPGDYVLRFALTRQGAADDCPSGEPSCPSSGVRVRLERGPVQVVKTLKLRPGS